MGVVFYVAVFGMAPVALAVLIGGLLLERGFDLSRLIRVDLAAMFVATAGIATMLGLARSLVAERDVLLGFTQLFLLPFVMPLVWLTRYVLEDTWSKSLARRRLEKAQPDLSFLSDESNGIK